jgi:hypothetical protein
MKHNVVNSHAMTDESSVDSASIDHMDDESHTKESQSDDDENSGAIKSQLSKNETNKVDVSRILVSCILLLVTISVSTVVFLISRNSEIKAFETQYEGAAEKLLDSFNTIMVRMGTINSLGVAATSHGISSVLVNPDDSNTNISSSAWPFVTVPSFEHRSVDVRILSSALYFSIHPIVDDSNRDSWETYTTSDNKKWM